MVLRRFESFMLPYFIGVTLVGWAFIGALTMFYASGYYHARAVAEWHQTTARIRNSDPTYHSHRGDWWWTLELQYDYEVDGQLYVGRSLTNGSARLASQQQANDLAQGMFAPGRRVPVYYDPDAPANAYLLRASVNPPNWTLVYLGTLLTPLLAYLFCLHDQAYFARLHQRHDFFAREHGPEDIRTELPSVPPTSSAPTSSAPTSSAPPDHRSTRRSPLTAVKVTLQQVPGDVAEYRRLFECAVDLESLGELDFVAHLTTRPDHDAISSHSGSPSRFQSDDPDFDQTFFVTTDAPEQLSERLTARARAHLMAIHELGKQGAMVVQLDGFRLVILKDLPVFDLPLRDQLREAAATLAYELCRPFGGLSLPESP